MTIATDYTAKELLEMTEYQTYVTTRGTTGDADGIIDIDDDTRLTFEDGKVISINDLLFENEKAFADVEEYMENHISARMTAEQCAEYAVIEKDSQYILVYCN